MTTKQALSRAFMIMTLTLAACSGDDTSSSEQAGASAETATGGKSAGGNGSAGKSGSGAGKSGSDGSKGGSTAAASGGSSGSATSSTPAGGLTFTCSEEPPKSPIKCGGEECKAPGDFAMNPCIVPCCVNEGGREQCGSKSTADMLTTQCVLPAKPASECPDVDSQTGPLKGCCNTQQHKCGIISTLRPGCITESQLIMFTGQQSCGMTGEDAGVDQDAG